MNILRCACVGCCLVLSIFAAQADEPDSATHNLAAQCAAKNGTFDQTSLQCTEPGADTPAGDPIVGPMMKVLGPEAQDADGHAGGQ